MLQVFLKGVTDIFGFHNHEDFNYNFDDEYFDSEVNNPQFVDIKTNLGNDNTPRKIIDNYKIKSFNNTENDIFYKLNQLQLTF